MYLTVLPEDIALIEATLKFANLSEITNTRDVETLFEVLPLARDYWQIIEDQSDIEGYKNDQRELQNWLSLIAQKGSVHKKDEKEIEKRIGTLGLNTSLTFQDMKFNVNTQFLFRGVQACYGYAMGLLLDEGLKLTDSIYKCELPECTIISLQNDGQGAPRKYCCTKHQNAHRSRKVRKRNREAKEKRKS